MFSWLPMVSAKGVDEFVFELVVFEKGFFESGFQLKVVFFEDALRCEVAAKRPGKYSIDIVSVESKCYDLLNGFTHDAFAPKGFTQPIAQFRVFSLNVVLRMNANATHCLAIYSYGKNVNGFIFGSERDECFAIFTGIGMRESIGHELCNLGIVGVLNQTFQIGKGPGSEAEGH